MLKCCEGPGQLLKHVLAAWIVQGQSLELDRPPDVTSGFAWAPPEVATTIDTSGCELQITTKSKATYLLLSAYFVCVVLFSNIVLLFSSVPNTFAINLF